MSSASDPHAHDAHDAHAFTGEPIQVLPADEPRTPGWLPLLGVALFTGAAVIFLAGRGASPDATAPAVTAPAATAPAAAVATAPAVVRPARPQPGLQGPGGAPTARPLTPDQRAQLVKRAGQAPPAPPAH